MIHYIEPYFPFDSNIYLLTGDTNILIDTGTGLSSKPLIDSIRSIIGPEGRLDKVLLTHCHVDHIGAGPALVEAFGCKVYSGFVDAVPIREGDYSYTLSHHFQIDLPGYPVEDLREGDVIDNGEHRLRVIETPGHTMGGVCYFDEISSSMFSGDTVFTDGVGRYDFKGGSLDCLRNSLRKISYMPVKGLYPGHGSPTDDGTAAVLRGLKQVGD